MYLLTYLLTRPAAAAAAAAATTTTTTTTTGFPQVCKKKSSTYQDFQGPFPVYKDKSGHLCVSRPNCLYKTYLLHGHGNLLKELEMLPLYTCILNVMFSRVYSMCSMYLFSCSATMLCLSHLRRLNVDLVQLTD